MEALSVGGPGSGRWHGHQRRPLVEEHLAIDLVDLRRSGALLREGFSGTLEWTTQPAGERLGVALLRLGPNHDGLRELELYVIRPGQKDTCARPRLAKFRPPLGGERWFFRCPVPGCDRRALKLYLEPDGERFGCRGCLGLIHRSAREHDARLDLARRDPTGFLEAREGLRSLRSQLVTFRLAQRASDYRIDWSHREGPRFRRKTGRGWARGSTTTHDRVVAEMRREWEAKWDRPFPSADQPAR